MTPIPPERVEIDGVNILEYLDLMKEKGLSWPHADAQIRYILSDYSSLRAENERLKKPIGFHDVDEFYPEEKEPTLGDWKSRAEKAEAEVERLKMTLRHEWMTQCIQEQVRADKAEAQLGSWKKDEVIWKETEARLLAQLAKMREGKNHDRP